MGIGEIIRGTVILGGLIGLFLGLRARKNE